MQQSAVPAAHRGSESLFIGVAIIGLLFFVYSVVLLVFEEVFG
jgi:hypothetical protein